MPKHYSDRPDQKANIKDETPEFPRGWLIVFIVGLLLFLPVAIIAHSHHLTGLQANIFHSINNLNLGPGFTTFAKLVTEVLGAGYAIAICVILPLLFKRFKLSWRFFFTAGGTVAVFYVIKKIINEPRPIVMLGGKLHQRVIETGPGFPSGHESAATALAITLWMILPNKWKWLSVLWILVVAFSRIYLGVHTPGDIIGGFGLGLMAVSFVNILPIKLSKYLRLDYKNGLLEKGW